MEKKKLLNKHQEKNLRSEKVSALSPVALSTVIRYHIRVKDVLRDSIMNFKNSRDREVTKSQHREKEPQTEDQRTECHWTSQKSNTRKEVGKQHKLHGVILSSFREINSRSGIL